MKKTLLIIGLGLVTTSSVLAQNCITLKKGQQITQTTSSWVNTLIADKKFIKSSETKRAEMVADYNKDCASGKIKGFGGTPYTLTMTDYSKGSWGESIAFQMGPYKFPMECKNDTLYLFRNKGIMRMEENVLVNVNAPNAYIDEVKFELTKKTIGFGSQGAAVFPNSLDIGDNLPLYEDIYLSVPTSWDDKIRHNVLTGYKKVTSTSYGYNSGVNSKGQAVSGIGVWEESTMKAVYKTIKTDAKVTISSSIYIMHHVFATVTDKVSLKIGKDSYDSYVIQSQRWTKNNEVTDWDTESQELNANMALWESDFKERIAKKFVKKGITNELGYIVEHVTEWFVPGIGVVQFESVDSHGVMTSKMTIDKIK